MAGFKRRRPSSIRRYKKRVRKARPSVQKIVNRAINKNIETKTAVSTTNDGLQIFHNDSVILENAGLLWTSQGITDPMTSNQNCRIGDKICLKGVSMKMMVELNERYSDVTFRLMVIRASRGDAPTTANLFVGQSTNKMLDKFNNERFTLLYQKYFKIKAPNFGTTGGEVAYSGFNNVGTATTLSRATRIIKVWIPGKKFTRSGVIVYDNGGNSPKFFDYHCVLYAYSNFSAYTGNDPGFKFYVGRVNDFIKTLHYKDG